MFFHSRRRESARPIGWAVGRRLGRGRTTVLADEAAHTQLAMGRFFSVCVEEVELGRVGVKEKP